MEEQDVWSCLCLIVFAAAYRQLLREIRRPRSTWVRPWIRRRRALGAHNSLLRELAEEDRPTYRNFLRMDKQDFDYLLGKVTPFILKHDTVMREAISPEKRLSLTLRYLATGDSYQSLSYLYRIAPSTVSSIIPETCTAIYKSMQDEYMKVPDKPEEWESIAEQFMEKWNFPNCIGALDGKHISIKKPNDSGSKFMNYKGFFGVVLLALVDADYKFIYVGCQGRISDGGVLANSKFGQLLESDQLNLPDGKPLPGRDATLPYVIVGDEAFPLKRNITKPYAFKQMDLCKRIFNYRLSRARRIVENVFGILVNRFTVLKHNIPLQPEKIEEIVLACCILHNYLRSTATSRNTYTPPEIFDNEDTENGTLTPGSWRSQSSEVSLLPLARARGTRPPQDAKYFRDEMC